MSFRYYHDPAGRTVFKVQWPPEVIPECDRKGKRTGWLVQGQTEITRADNMLLAGNQWKYRTSASRQERYDSKGDHASVLEFFGGVYLPNHDEVDRSTYEKFCNEYQQLAMLNKPDKS